MAGWSMIADDECVLECSETPPKKLELKGLLLGFDPFSRLCSLTTESDARLRCQFDNCIKYVRKDICALDVAFPPMLGNGQPVDLFKLFLVVREKGGYDAVSKHGLWDVVAEESGLGLNLSPSLKLLYVKYLGALEKGLKVCNEVKSMVGETDGSKKCDSGDGNDVIVSDLDSVEESICTHKRKRESMCRMLNWITGVARNPCDHVVDSLPEMSKWESYGNDQVWKQVLMAREALFLKRHDDSGAEQSIGKKNRKMHPCLYDDQIGSAYNFRERLRCSKKLPHGVTPSQAQANSQLSSSTTETDSNSCTKGVCDSDSSTEYSLLDLPVEKPIPLGPDFQAEVPEWTDAISQSDSKWLGQQVWPPEKIDNRFVVEREPIGKGRQDSCGCEVAKSVECIRFHINERRSRLKRELGIAFHHWRFDNMGEDVQLSWKEEEKKKFKAIVQLNPPSLDKCFWDEIFKAFLSRSREDLVSYYFNVFLLQRRAHQNRFTPNSVDSDDDESECGSVTNSSRHEAPKSPASLLYSAKKSRKNVR